jgi:DNA-binding transcriptional LysR family regulator
MRLATPETLEEDLDDFFDLHQRRWNKRWLPGAFASRRARSFHADAARRLLAAGMLRLHMLFLDGEAQGALYCFQKGRRCYYYLGGFEPDIRHRTMDATVTIALAAHGLALTMLPQLALLDCGPGVALRAIAEGPVSRMIFAATRATDTARPSTQALLAAVRERAAAVAA